MDGRLCLGAVLSLEDIQQGAVIKSFHSATIKKREIVMSNV